MTRTTRACTTTSFDGARLTYERTDGHGTPVVLIHGWGCRRGHWRGQAPVLEGVPTVTLDLAGHGDSTCGEQQRSPQAFARDVEAVLQAENLEAAVLVGHSMGGAVALEAARATPRRVAGVVMVDTFVIDYGGLDAQTQQALYDPFAQDFPAAVARLVDDTGGGADDALKRRLVDDMTGVDPHAALPAWRALLAWDPTPALAEVRVPVHAINGDLIPASARERCSPLVTETVVPGTGHFLQMEAPQRFNEAFAATLHALRA